jgi:hypothetical protein
MRHPIWRKDWAVRQTHAIGRENRPVAPQRSLSRRAIPRQGEREKRAHSGQRQLVFKYFSHFQLSTPECKKWGTKPASEREWE